MANFRFRRGDGGSTLRGGDGLRAIDAQTFSYVASGGIEYAGEADYQFVDVDTYIASGGIRFSGAGATAFLPAAQPQPAGEQGHGRGPFYQLRGASVPLAIRQYGDKVTFRCRARGGIRYGGEADCRLVRFYVVFAAPTSAVVLKFSGKAKAWRGNDDDDDLALAA